MTRLFFLILIILSVACNKQEKQFVDGAVRGPTSIPPIAGSEDAIKFSNGNARAKGTRDSMSATISPTNVRAKGTHLSMTVGISRTPVLTQ